MAEPTTVVPLEVTPARAQQVLGPEWRTVALHAYRWMVLARTLDARMLALQRQGRVGFYGAATGQEAVNVAAGLVSAKDDWVLPGLREQLVALVRGHALGPYVHHLFGDAYDPALGRNMPCHPTAREVHYVSMSSVIGTQISHAAGVAFGLRHRKERAVALAFFGDGATSSNDFHAGVNLAAVLRLPVAFLCTNNQWAISVPVQHQTAAKSLAAKATAYGIAGQRVDGTDLFACWTALAGTLGRVRAGGPAEMIEFVVYRMTAHSSSDDPSRYQPPDWAERARAHDPVARLERWLTEQGLLDRPTWQRITTEVDQEVRAAVEAAEAAPPPPASSLTADVLAPSRSGPPAA
ncbi:MAG TPA: thiamine pyrophosphate-dependent enzyme [Thermoplasmata archaeon]|nr:thiamine pyrophosphate-dependent enzyme [Thermoplasmata archaeon]